LEPQPQTSGFVVIVLDVPVDLTRDFFDSARELAAKYGAV
jgi:hypothetical protein